MTTYKKTIVLNNSKLKNYGGSAILTLVKNSDGVMGTLKTFNISNKPNLVLGLAQNNKQVFKQNINLYNNNTYSFKLNALNLNETLSCVLVEDEPDKVIPLIWGSDSKNELKEEIISNLNILKCEVKKAEIKPQKQLNLDEMFDITNVEDVINENLNISDFEINNQAELNSSTIYPNETDILNLEQLSNNTSNIKNINESINAKQSITQNSASEDFEDYNNLKDSIEFNSETLDNHNAYSLNEFTSSLSGKTIIDEEMENLNLNENETFFESVAEQVENLFNTYPAETNLEELIPNSKWVKIDYENDGNFYVLGLIYEDITLKYLCYGVPGEYAETAPNGLDNYSQWLPTDVNNPTQNGYWVMYQDAITGESIMVDAI